MKTADIAEECNSAVRRNGKPVQRRRTPGTWRWVKEARHERTHSARSISTKGPEQARDGRQVGVARGRGRAQERLLRGCGVSSRGGDSVCEQCRWWLRNVVITPNAAEL